MSSSPKYHLHCIYNKYFQIYKIFKTSLLEDLSNTPFLSENWVCSCKVNNKFVTLETAFFMASDCEFSFQLRKNESYQAQFFENRVYNFTR
jgi:hypothetical protein